MQVALYARAEGCLLTGLLSGFYARQADTCRNTWKFESTNPSWTFAGHRNLRQRSRSQRQNDSALTRRSYLQISCYQSRHGTGFRVHSWRRPYHPQSRALLEQIKSLWTDRIEDLSYVA